MYHVEDLSEGILKNEEFLQFGGRPRQIGEYDQGFIANGIAGIVKSIYEAFDAPGSGEDTFLGSLGACLRYGADELQGVQTGVEVWLLEEVDEEGYVVLSLP